MARDPVKDSAHAQRVARLTGGFWDRVARRSAWLR